ncbi:MAG: prepilin peptidase [Candidatus Margulisiibacteriota bacterium]|nr:MAG: hypothetical protein A2X43_01695 [Candidatus Margulisbacteria bacterium GWD2_39_127]OGI05501.1 MAG: hypothetical protein A2X42_00140 [Candidatus Margulisbacteria bacterium GWF2_38_17]OGI08301.1 MAG: hypothetical protein A2X41_00105 [Candidatus Margulisbacteria bacterium GWE2_39_32]PZM82295.1 MAG: prepilin peptidase [Candidatus Margulisiibacteriota bacterium]HAR62959.1 prepilin peptidase [Candidatus Margulisiibacteriota bacterium]
MITNLAIAFLFGSVIGSFLNVLIFRIPLRQSIIFPPSHCTTCNHKLSVLDLFPLLSYLFLKGKCRYCKEKIKWHYPLVELLSGFSFVWAFYSLGPSFLFLKVVFLTSILIVITFIDLEFMIIPDELTLGGSGIGLLFSLFDKSLLPSVLGGLAGAGIIYAIYLLGQLIYQQETIGGGDIKMMLLIGIFIGIKSTLLAIFVAMMLGSIIGVALIALRIKSRKDYIPFGPFLGAGCLIVIYFSKELVALYRALVI